LGIYLWGYPWERYSRAMDSTDWDERYSAQDLVWSAGPNQFVADLVAPLPPGRALDLAAGEGRNAIWLAGLGWTVTAVDFSAVGLDKGRRLASGAGVGERIQWVEADLTRWSPEPGSADLVLIAYLQLPQRDMVGVLARASAALDAGGSLVAVGHDRSNLGRGFGGPKDPEVLWDPDYVGAAVGSVPDVEVTRREIVERIRDEGVAYDTLVTATRCRQPPKTAG
jgi:SAM-dependent methyltransferase